MFSGIMKLQEITLPLESWSLKTFANYRFDWCLLYACSIAHNDTIGTKGLP